MTWRLERDHGEPHHLCERCWRGQDEDERAERLLKGFGRLDDLSTVPCDAWCLDCGERVGGEAHANVEAGERRTWGHCLDCDATWGD